MIKKNHHPHKKFITSITHHPATLLYAPRGMGSTTLCLEASKTVPSLYLSLEHPEHAQALKNTPTFLTEHKDKLIIIDDLHHSPSSLSAIKDLIEAQDPSIRLLITGVHSKTLLSKSTEVLGDLVHYLPTPSIDLFEVKEAHQRSSYKLWMRGGFPESYWAKNDAKSMAWRKKYILSYLKDLPRAQGPIPQDVLQRFCSMMAYGQGMPWDADLIDNSLMVHEPAAQFCLDYLEDLFLLRKLPPWDRESKKELVRSPKIYVRDSGLLHALLDIPDFEHLIGHLSFDASWEGFVIEQILSSLPPTIKPSFYYSTVEIEVIDLILEFQNGEIWAINIKKPTLSEDLERFLIACHDIKTTRKFILYDIAETYNMADDTTATFLEGFLLILKEHLQKL